MSAAPFTQPRPFGRRVGLAVVALVVIAAPAACGDTGAEQRARRETTTSTTTSTTSPSGPCGLADATDITFSAGRDGAMLHAVLTGQGPSAIVLAHESDDDACDWAFFVPELTADDRQILAFDFSGNGSSSRIGDGRLDLDLLAAVTEVRNRGATRVVVIGASMGGTAALAAAGTPDNGIDGVVSLSAVSSWLHTNAESNAATISIPVLFAAAENDRSTAETAQTVSASADAPSGTYSCSAAARTARACSPRDPTAPHCAPRSISSSPTRCSDRADAGAVSSASSIR